MTDWGIAVKIAAGGFGMVFLLLAILSIQVKITSLVVKKCVKTKPKE